MAARKVTTMRVSREEIARGRVPWKLRVKAWWNGYDIRLPKGGGPAASAHGVPRVESYATELPWDDPRIGLVQEVWGEGFERPGGPQWAIDLARPAGLNPSMNVAEIGAGLGGGARAISKSFDVWISGFESDPVLARVGAELSNIAGLGKKAAIHHCPPSEPPLKARSYNCLLAREAFFRVPDKTLLLETVDQALKPGGQFVFTDYVLADDIDDAGDDAVLRAWREGEPEAPHPWRPRDYRAIFERLDLDMRVSEDVTDRHAAMIREHWEAYRALAARSRAAHSAGGVVVAEAELWGRRLRALESGALRVYRFLALKRKQAAGADGE